MEFTNHYFLYQNASKEKREKTSCLPHVLRVQGAKSAAAAAADSRSRDNDKNNDVPLTK